LISVNRSARADAQHVRSWGVVTLSAFSSGECSGQQAAYGGGCPGKGNVSANGRIYHTPGSRDYEKVVIDPAKGERYFCSEEEARASGWRKPEG
jgi:hypothetical protein